MTAKASDYVSHFAHQLRNADPKAYQSFIEALDAYAMEITVAVTSAPATDILNMQGRAAQQLLMVKQLSAPRPLPSSPQPQPAAAP